jgi:beta-mannosidase
LAFGIPSLGSIGKSIDTEMKMSSPADVNASWSFLDVTEYYVSKLYGADLTNLKELDIDRYRLLCGTAMGEVMYYVQSQWRRKGVACNGSLHIALNDAAEGNGWGLIDSKGGPKAPYFFLKRAWDPLTLIIVDEGVDGLKLIVHNDRPMEFLGTLNVAFCRFDGVVVHGGELDLNLAARSRLELRAESIVGHFVDSSYTYQFGAPAFDYVVGELVDTRRAVVEETIWLVGRSQISPIQEIDVKIDVMEQEDGNLRLVLLASRFVQSLTLVTNQFDVSDNCFHLPPNKPKSILAQPRDTADHFLLTARGTNMSNTVEARFSKQALALG